MAKDWMSSSSITSDNKVFATFTLVLCGVATWDILKTAAFDLSIITGKRRWKWPMTLYFAARVFMMIHIYAITINRNAVSEIPCTSITILSKVAGAIAACTASLILLLRTREFWQNDVKVTAVLGVLLFGQIGLWSQTLRYFKSQWNLQTKQCSFVSIPPIGIAIAVFGYTMAMYLVFLVFSTIGLVMRRNRSLFDLVFNDGMGYFFIAFSANLVQTIMASVNLNPVMNIIALPFAIVVPVVAATTVLRNALSASHHTGSHSSSLTSEHPTELRMFFTSADGSRRQFGGQVGDGQKSAGDVGLIAVHRVVDIEVDDDAESSAALRRADAFDKKAIF